MAIPEENPAETGGFPSQRASNAKSVPMSWCLHDFSNTEYLTHSPLGDMAVILKNAIFKHFPSSDI